MAPFSHEKFVDKVRQANAEHLDEGEQVEAAVGGQTATVHTSPLFAMVDVGKRFTGGLQSRLVVLTDRNLYLANPGFFGQFEMKEVKAKLPRAEAASHVTPSENGLTLGIDAETVHFKLGTRQHVKNLAAAAAGGTTATSD